MISSVPDDLYRLAKRADYAAGDVSMDERIEAMLSVVLPAYRAQVEREVLEQAAQDLHERALRQKTGSPFRRHLLAAARIVASRKYRSL